MGIIYMARNKVNDKVYVGQTVQKLVDRKKRHKWDAKKKDSHFNRAIRKYGFDAFEWHILEVCERERLGEREVYWLQRLDSYRNGYNSRTIEQGNEIISDETKRKIAASWTPERKERFKELTKGNKGRLGQPHSQESIEKMRASAIGRRWSPDMIEHFRRVNRGNGRHKGFHHTNEVKNRLSEMAKKPIRCIETGEVYKGIVDASASIGQSVRHISRAVNKGTSAKGFHFKRIDSWN